MALFPLGVMVELLINGTFTDISSYILQRDTITITGGKTNRGDTNQPATAVFTVNNRDGRFSPLYSGGAYYPYLQRNVQVRISVTDTSASGNFYSGYRFWGEVHEWPPLSDISGHDVFVKVTASGPLRRLRANGGRGSALNRYYATLTGSFAPIAYWPCEEHPTSTIVGAGVEGGQNMTVTVGTPKWKALDKFNGSHPVAVVDQSTWDGITGSFGSSGNDVYSAPGTYQFVASTTTVDARCWGGGAGGNNGAGGAGGGGGEFAKEASLAVTIGNTYSLTVGAGGPGGAGSGTTNNAGTAGSDSFISGDSVTVRAHGGGAGNNLTGGTGGTGSANTTHFNGGNGGSNASNDKGGAGGGGSAGTAAGGNAGGTPSACAGAPGGAAVTGGGAGGHGAPGCANPSQGSPGVSPGGGGGGGGDATSGYNWAGGSGAPGQVALVYAAQTTATTNVLRFIMYVPPHGGNNGKVLVRMATGGTIARLDVEYVSVGKVRIKGYDSGLALKFTSSSITVGNGQSVMISAELSNSGANVAYALKAIIPGGSALLASTSGTQTTASVGNVSEVLVSPNADITKTGIGHISVQYALVSLRKVSRALNGHHTEMGIDRFIRLANEQALGAIPEFNETNDHWGFETGTQSWVGTNAALTNPTTVFTPVDTDTTPNLTLYPILGQAQAWPPEGTHSLLLTCNGSANPAATSPTGTSGEPVSVGDIVSAGCEVYCPATKNNVFVGLLWYTAAGAACAHAEDDSADSVFAAGEMQTLTVSATAPATAAFFAVKVGDHETPANGQLIYVDNVRAHPQMGPQTTKELHHFLQEIEDLDQGILKEAKTLWGLKYRTRLSLINQAAAVTLDYSAGTIAPPLEPVVDEKLTANDITVHRHKGSSIRVTQNSGSMSVTEPPAGTGRHKKHLRIAAKADEQLAALAAHLLAIGTAADERYPVITVNLARAGILNNAVAPLMSAIAGIEIGDFVQLTNLPFWYPATTAKQLVIGYTETLNAFEWTVAWNCVPEGPYEIVATALRRW